MVKGESRRPSDLGEVETKSGPTGSGKDRSRVGVGAEATSEAQPKSRHGDRPQVGVGDENVDPQRRFP